MFERFRKKGNPDPSGSSSRTGRVRCHQCGEWLNGSNTYLLNGKKVCTECYRSVRPDSFCSRCRSEGPLYEYRGKKYCNTCYWAVQAIPKCALCGRPFEGNEHQNRVMLRQLDHSLDSYVFCDFCARIVAERKIDHVLRLAEQPEKKSTRKVYVPGTCCICKRQTLTVPLGISNTTGTIPVPDMRKPVCAQCEAKYYRNVPCSHSDWPDYMDGIDPVSIENQDIRINTEAMRAYILCQRFYERRTSIRIAEEETVICIFADEDCVRSYHLEGKNAGLKDRYFNLLMYITHSYSHDTGIVYTTAFLSAQPVRFPPPETFVNQLSEIMTGKLEKIELPGFPEEYREGILFRDFLAIDV